MILIVSSTSAITLKIDPAVVLATRQYVDGKIIEVKGYADDLMKKHVEAANPHKQYPLIANALKEMVDAGLAGDVLKNLGLGEGSALPVGVPVPWPSATPPTGWLKCNGAAFSAEEYPELAKVYPTNKLPDLRGEFIRGWDDGRGIDTNRSLLSSQGDAIRNIIGALVDVRFNTYPSDSGAFTTSVIGDASSDSIKGGYAKRVTFDASRVVPTANENRPRNIAFNYIVRAA